MCRSSHLVVAVIAGATILFSAVGAFPENPASQKSCVLLVTLFNKPFPDESDIRQVPLTFDAHIAMRAVVDESLVGHCGFSAGDRVIFLIHSPSRTFGTYWFHDKQFFLTLEASNEEETGRLWDLTGLDWPLTTQTPYFDKNLICLGEAHVVRTVVGESNNMIGPFSVFHDDRLVISLGTVELARTRPARGDRLFSVEYPGDATGRALKPAFYFSADHDQARLTIGSKEVALSCRWPNER